MRSPAACQCRLGGDETHEPKGPSGGRNLEDRALSAESWMLLEGGTIVVALLLAHLWRQANRHGIELESKLADQMDRAKRLGNDLSKEVQTRKRQSEELATIRNRADKIKRRQSKTEDQPLGTAARIRDHEAEAERFRLECDRVSSERDALANSIVDLENRLEISARALDRAAEAIATAEATPKASATKTDSGDLLGVTQNELVASRECVANLENQLEIARLTEARMRKRMSNQELLYASVRSELDVKKDRLRTQEEQLQRLQALKVAVLD